MTVLAPGSFAWLAWHEMTLAWRSRARKGITRWLGLLLLIGYAVIGCVTAVGLIGVPITFNSWVGVGILAGTIVGLSFMTTQAILGSQQTLYESRDLDLLFTAPIDGRTVLLAKLAGIVGPITLTYAVLLLPMVVPIAILGHPGLLGALGLLAALAMIASAFGIAITLVLARVAGPRAARTVGQIAAAVMGGALFLTSQFSQGRRGSAFSSLFDRFRAMGWGDHGWSGIPGHAAFGDLIPLAVVLTLGLVLFIGAGAVLRRLFLSGYQDAGVKLSRAKPTGKASSRLFHAGLFRSILAKEWRLLARDPGIVFQVILRLVYLAPLMLGAMRGGAGFLVPGLAFASVLVATQVTGSFAWLTVSAEDAPELITVAPVDKAQVDLAKLATALLMAAPLALLLPIVIATVGKSPIGALITLVMTAIGGSIAGYIELKLGKPGQRAKFAKRRQGGFVAGLLGMIVAVIFGGGAALAVYLIGT
jgi:ABC-2 type transport system permease protein